MPRHQVWRTWEERFESQLNILLCCGDQRDIEHAVIPACSDDDSEMACCNALATIFLWSTLPLTLGLACSNTCEGSGYYWVSIPTPPPTPPLQHHQFPQVAPTIIAQPRPVTPPEIAASRAEAERLRSHAANLAEQNRQAAIALEIARKQFEEERQRRLAAEAAGSPFAINPVFARPSAGDLSGRHVSPSPSSASSSGFISQQPSMSSPVPTLSGKEIIFTPSIKSMLGQGGFGMVYKGKWNDINVAVKQLKESFINEEASKQFASEVSTMAKLRHPHIVIMYGAVTDIVPNCIVMELMTESLQQILLDSRRQLPWDTRYRYSSEIVSGVGYLHAQHIVHRDLKSSNVLADPHGRLKISDFGLARVIAETTVQGQKAYMGHSAGTVTHMAPEILGLEARYSYYSDVYAFGMLLWEMSSRQPPYRGVDQQIVIACVKNGEREKIPADTPHVMKEIIQDCWAVEPRNRPMMTKIFQRLQEAAETMSTHSSQASFADNLATS